MPVKIKSVNLFNSISIKSSKEQFTDLLKGSRFKITKIVSNGFKSPENNWMSEPSDEWVILLKGRAKLEIEGGNIISLIAGDYILIPANTKHKLLYTSKKPFCYWLAIHFK